MRKFLITAAAGMAIFSAGALTAGIANATPTGSSTGVALALDGISPVTKVAICFYFDGWNGPGMYECGFRHRHGQGWHGKRRAEHNNNRNDDNYDNKRRYRNN